MSGYLGFLVRLFLGLFFFNLFSAGFVLAQEPNPQVPTPLVSAPAPVVTVSPPPVITPVPAIPAPVVTPPTPPAPTPTVQPPAEIKVEPQSPPECTPETIWKCDGKWDKGEAAVNACDGLKDCLKDCTCPTGFRPDGKGACYLPRPKPTPQPDPICGDGAINGTDQCEKGQAGCTETCTCGEGWEYVAGNGCVPNCGNGTINAGEACDKTNLGGATCTSLGLAGGALSCTAECKYDFSSCLTLPNTPPPPPELYCGDGILNTSEEECDAGLHVNGTSASTCTWNCKIVRSAVSPVEPICSPVVQIGTGLEFNGFGQDDQIQLGFTSSLRCQGQYFGFGLRLTPGGILWPRGDSVLDNDGTYFGGIGPEVYVPVGQYVAFMFAYQYRWYSDVQVFVTDQETGAEVVDESFTPSASVFIIGVDIIPYRRNGVAFAFAPTITISGDDLTNIEELGTFFGGVSFSVIFGP